MFCFEVASELEKDCCARVGDVWVVGGGGFAFGQGLEGVFGIALLVFCQSKVVPSTGVRWVGLDGFFKSGHCLVEIVQLIPREAEFVLVFGFAGGEVAGGLDLFEGFSVIADLAVHNGQFVADRGRVGVPMGGFGVVEQGVVEILLGQRPSAELHLAGGLIAVVL